MQRDLVAPLGEPGGRLDDDIDHFGAHVDEAEGCNMDDGFATGGVGELQAPAGVGAHFLGDLWSAWEAIVGE